VENYVEKWIFKWENVDKPLKSMFVSFSLLTLHNKRAVSMCRNGSFYVKNEFPPPFGGIEGGITGGGHF
jgi:hypothetical protein